MRNNTFIYLFIGMVKVYHKMQSLEQAYQLFVPSFFKINLDYFDNKSSRVQKTREWSSNSLARAPISCFHNNVQSPSSQHTIDL